MTRRKYMIRDVEAAVCLRFGVTPAQIRSGDARREYARPRHIAWLLAREFTAASFPQIARYFGHRHHSTVILGCRSIQRVILANNSLAADVEGIREILPTMRPAAEVLAAYVAAGLQNPMREAA